MEKENKGYYPRKCIYCANEEIYKQVRDFASRLNLEARQMGTVQVGKPTEEIVDEN